MSDNASNATFVDAALDAAVAAARALVQWDATGAGPEPAMSEPCRAGWAQVQGTGDRPRPVFAASAVARVCEPVGSSTDLPLPTPSHVDVIVGGRSSVDASHGAYELKLRYRVGHDGEPDAELTAVSSVCTACVALGVDGLGDPCVECGAEGWDPWFGEAVDLSARFRPVSATRKLTVPTNRLYRLAHRRS